MNFCERIEDHLNGDTFDNLNNCLNDILAEVHELCADALVDEFNGKRPLNETREITVTYLKSAIDAYNRKIEEMSTISDVTTLYNENKLATSISDTELSRKDAINGFKELKNLAKIAKVPKNRIIAQLIISLQNAVNAHLRLFRSVMQQTNHEAMLRGKDFSDIDVKGI